MLVKKPLQHGNNAREETIATWEYWRVVEIGMTRLPVHPTRESVPEPSIDENSDIVPKGLTGGESADR
jgi:hypothetical protein